MLDLFMISWKATKEYVAKNIDNDINNMYYTYTARVEITDLVLESKTLEDLIYNLLMLKQNLYNRKHKKSFLYNPSKYENMAVDQALDIATSLQKRFIIGHNNLEIVLAKQQRAVV